MSSKKVLALSSSRAGREDYLESPVLSIKEILGIRQLSIAFIPFALVSKKYDAYANDVSTALKGLPYKINIADHHNAIKVIEQSDAIMVGGGNTFKLLHDIYESKILDLIRNKVENGTPYIGWSAGANITGPTIGTTNDMPVIQPESFKALSFFPFQINPHYFNQKPKGFNGETRDQRLLEFVTMNPTLKVIGLPEGTGLLLNDRTLKLIGKHPAKLFSAKVPGEKPVIGEINPEEDISYMLS
ncbi:MAG: dipeptidase PepE [Ginsengibacter sp.]